MDNEDIDQYRALEMDNEDIDQYRALVLVLKGISLVSDHIGMASFLRKKTEDETLTHEALTEACNKAVKTANSLGAAGACKKLIIGFSQREVEINLHLDNDNLLASPCMLNKSKFISWLLRYARDQGTPFEISPQYFMLCATVNNLKTMRVLYDYTVEINEPFDLHSVGERIVHVACQNRYNKMAKYWATISDVGNLDSPTRLVYLQIAAQYDNNVLLKWFYNMIPAENRLHAALTGCQTAVSKGQLNNLNYFLRKLKKLDETDPQPNITVEHFWGCCSSGSVDTAKWIRKHVGKNQFREEFIPHEGYKAFRSAMSNGHMKMARWLLGEDPTTPVHGNDEEAFALACANGYLKAAKWLYSWCLKHETPINIRAREDTAFRHSWANGWPAVTEWLAPMCKDYYIEKQKKKITEAYVLNDMKRAQLLLELGNINTFTKALNYLGVSTHNCLLRDDYDHCIICLDDSLEYLSVRLGCGHDYCLICLLKWFDENRLVDKVCTCCKQEIDFSKAVLVEPDMDTALRMDPNFEADMAEILEQLE